MRARRRSFASGLSFVPSLVWLPAFLLVAAAPLAAQAPRITRAGDPSVRNDTLYRLAVDAAREGIPE